MPDGKIIDLYGIVNCDQVKKARAWLDEAGVAYRFHDFKKEPPDAALIGRWLKKAGWETLVNRRGTTWRGIAEDERPATEAAARVAMLEKPTLIKRPVASLGETLVVGFDEVEYQRLFHRT
jgi:Spx/MgsR family transcriptional regulator